jgi:hypothetical protein
MLPPYLRIANGPAQAALLAAGPGARATSL